MQGSARIDELRQKFHENPRRYFAPLANEYRKAGDPEQAIAICKAHLAQQPGHMSGHVVYAQSLHDAGRIDESRVAFEKALSLDPDNALVLRLLGDISRQHNDSAEARHWYSRALEADPGDREVAAYIAELTEPVTEPAQEAEPPIAVDPLPATEQVTASAPERDEPTMEAPVEEPPVEKPPVEEARVANEVFVAEPVAASREEVEPAAAETAAVHDREVAPLAWELADETRDDEIETATTPLTTGSPFVTRTMADLYARQGYYQQALEVYRELAAADPDDADIAERVRELSAVSEVAISPVELVDTVAAENATAETSASTSEPPNEFAEHVEVDTDVAPLAGEEAADSIPASASDTTTKTHFTEMELAPGDQWDTDPWGAGFSSDDGDIVPFDSSPSNAFPETPEAVQHETASGAEGTASPALEPHDAREASSKALEPDAVHDEPEASAAHEMAAEPELSAATLHPGVMNHAREDISTEGMFALSSPPPALEYAGESPSAEDAVVAYSPHTPDEKDLAHYTPEGPTIREFFATLGAYRVPDRDAQPSFTARAAVPEMERAEPEEAEEDEIWSPAAAETPAEKARESDAFPLASEAFANLFPDSPVSDEDSRAAFALSGAMTSEPPQSPRATPPKPPAPATAEPATQPPPASAPQESEEDIRRFREWLDGLADS